MLDAAEENGVPPPQIAEGPALFSWLEETYQAFWRLSRQRGSGFSGPEKLRAGDILQFYDAFEPYESKEEFYELITALDECYITFAMAAIQKRNNSGGGSTP